jgi:hypothetical protein
MTPITAAFDTYVTQYPLLANYMYSAANKDSVYKSLVDLKGADFSPLPHGVETHIGYGLDIMAKRSDTSAFTFDSPGSEGTKKTYFSNYGLGVIYTENLFMDGMYGIIEKVDTDLGNTYDLTRNVQVAAMYDDFFTGSISQFLAYDGQPVLSTSHTSSPGITRANKPSVAQPLSYTGVKTVLTTMRRFKTERGRPKMMVENGQAIKVLIPPEMEFLADSIFDTGSAYNPTNANNDINVLKKFRWDVIINPYLTSETNWFFMPTGENMIRLVDRQPFTDDKNPDIDTKGVRHDVRARWVLHVEHFDRIFGSNG